MATRAQQEAREHYDTRTQRRPRQWWRDSTGSVAAPKGAKGAVPVKLTNTQEETK